MLDVSKPTPDQMGITCPRHPEQFFIPCPECNAEAQQALEEEKAFEALREKYRARMERGNGATKLVEFGWASTASEAHPDRNEDKVGIYPEDNLFVVFDGVGGAKAGDKASQLARDGMRQKYHEVLTVIQVATPDKLAEDWEKLIAGNAFIGEDVALRSARQRETREREIREAREQLDALNLPEEVKREAVALRQALQEISNDIYTTSIAVKEKTGKRPFEGMASTAASTKIIEALGRRFIIAASVGDSDISLERAATGAIVPAVKTDGLLDYMITIGETTKAAAEQAVGRVKEAWAKNKEPDEHDLFLYKAYFGGITQALGMKTTPIPRVMIWELFPGDRLLLSSDFLKDNDQKERWKNRIRNRTTESLEEVAADLVDDGFEGIKTDEGKGWDDASHIVLEIKEPAWMQVWDTILDDECKQQTLPSTIEALIRPQVQAEKAKLLRSVMDDARRMKDMTPRNLQALMRDIVRVRIETIRKSLPDLGQRAA